MVCGGGGGGLEWVRGEEKGGLKERVQCWWMCGWIWSGGEWIAWNSTNGGYIREWISISIH